MNNLGEDFSNFARKRCERKLLGSEKYRALLKEDEEKANAYAEELCYICGYNDAIEKILNR